MFSVVPERRRHGWARPADVDADVDGHPEVLCEGYTHVVPFNDVAALERLLAERGDEIACLIIEPVMMNIGIVEPRAGLPRAAEGAAAPARRRC